MTSVGLFGVYTMEGKLDELIKEIRRSRCEVEDKLTTSIAKLKNEVNSVKREVNAAQEKTSQDLSKKIGNSNYQFKRKGNEHQYNFNCAIEEAVCSVKEELSKVQPADPDEKATLKRAETKLSKGTKALPE